MNIGVAAHITAAATGGPRFDPTLTEARRRAITNGIWLCQFCAKLIDNDDPRFPVALLHKWKDSAEERAKDLLEHPSRPEGFDEPILTIPASDPSISPLPFSARAVSMVGRETEMQILYDFLQSEALFSWMLLTGPAGSGKSRLALELCYSARPEWNTGFLSRADNFTAWAHFRPLRRTLIVIDYVSARIAEASAIILSLAQSAGYLRDRVRVLLIERELGSWRAELLRAHSNSESATIAEAEHREPVTLGPLTYEALETIAHDLVTRENLPWNETTARQFEGRMRVADPLGRPLFGILVAVYSSDYGGGVVSPTLLDQVLTKESSRRRQLLPDPEQYARMENLATLATFVGGLVPFLGNFDHLSQISVANIIANVDLVDREIYQDFVSGTGADSILPGFQPDILGERLILNRLTSTATSGVMLKLRDAAWGLQTLDLCAFVVRVAADFPDHPGLAILCDLALNSATDRVAWAYLVGNLIQIAARADDGLVTQLLDKLKGLSQTNVSELTLQNGLARAELFMGNKLREELKYERAAVHYDAGLGHATPGGDLQAALMNNRGILYDEMASEEEAFAAFTAVIDNTAASDEGRACSLNNRADIFARRGHHDAAIRDRSQVLSLAETSPDRRYIALARRSKSYRQLSHDQAALDDLTRILHVADIAPEQKSEARLHRGALYKNLGRLSEARGDLETVCAAPEVFPGTRANALVELADISRIEEDFSDTRECLDVATHLDDCGDETAVDALIVWARTLEDQGLTHESESIWRGVLDNPSSTPTQREIAAQKSSG